MPIKNYTTEVGAARTVQEISSLLSKRGATSVVTDYDGGEATGVRFAIRIPDGGTFFYQLPCRAEGVLSTMKSQRVERRLLTIQQARRVGWRIVKDWLVAQFALIDAGAAEVPEVFLPYMLVSPSETVYQRFQVNGMPALVEGAR